MLCFYNLTTVQVLYLLNKLDCCHREATSLVQQLRCALSDNSTLREEVLLLRGNLDAVQKEVAHYRSLVRDLILANPTTLQGVDKFQF